MSRLKTIMARLRSPEGCPWDRAQTALTLTSHIIEEAYETVEAIEGGKVEAIREELGDLLLQVLFQSQIAEEHGRFRLEEVVEGLCDKLVRRHPHVFGDTRVNSAKEAFQSWERMKGKEKKKGESVLSGLPRSLPALLKGVRIGERMARKGFDWPDTAGIFDKIREECGEMEEAVQNKTNIEEELGDLLFALTNLARKLDIDPERALRGSLEKNTQRFIAMEQLVADSDQEWEKMTLEEKETLWQRVKQEARIKGF